MKRLDAISNKIKSNKSNYFGRGHFEALIKQNKELILGWFEELKPVQDQIKELIELGCENLQKRNYVRIITTLFPQEYAQFIALNILLRDIDSITAVVKGFHDIRRQYDTLVEYNKLKFPGRHQKFVDFHTYQQFVTFYKEDLINRAQNFEIDESIEIEPHQQYIYNVHAKKEAPKKVEVTDEVMDELSKTELLEEDVTEQIKDLKMAKPTLDKEKTNWMKVLLKGV
ncbi:MAG: hypothetical protein ACNI3C_09015 [Candidatus Marinarcus sp.]|uniref:hypothetical protein n=1 Tax=Candidatus Marinarcus sp. TaxID=3100987 RepID=UPI003B0043ED